MGSTPPPSRCAKIAGTANTLGATRLGFDNLSADANLRDAGAWPGDSPFMSQLRLSPQFTIRSWHVWTQGAISFATARTGNLSTPQSRAVQL